MQAALTNTDSALAAAFQDLEEAREDFRQSEFHDAPGVLTRLLLAIDREPLKSFLGAVLPSVDFDAWWRRAAATVGSFAGSGNLDWPHDRAERVSMQVALCRAIASQRLNLLDFVHGHFSVGNSLSAHVFVFNAKILVPLVRDVRRLAELRPIAPMLAQAMGQLPASGDTILDGLLQDACERFRDPAPAARRDAVEKLWDGWERLKTLDVLGNKSVSVEALLNGAAQPGSDFRTLLQIEAKTLTDIGNSFHIRHFETNREPLSWPEDVDYLFHRLYALVHLLLSARSRTSDGH